MELARYLSLLNLSDKEQAIFAHALRVNPHIRFEPKAAEGKGSYAYRSTYDIHNSDQLVQYLQKLPTLNILNNKLLNESLNKKEEDLRQLEGEHKALILRSRKDDKAKAVWLDDPTLANPIDSEFRDMWGRIRLPDPEVTATELEKNGLVPTNKSKAPKVVARAPERNRRKMKKSTKLTNPHMNGVLKDYSNMRK